MDLQFKPGDSIQWAGVAALDGVTNFTGYTLQCKFKQSTPTWTPGADLATAVVTWVDPLVGTFMLSVASAVTANWPLDIDVLLDLVLLSPAGVKVTTATAKFRTVFRVTG